MEEAETQNEIEKLESEMQSADFWQDKEKAKEVLKKIGELKEKEKSKNKYDKGDAVVSIFSGAGGDDAEDWTRILFEMYQKFAQKNGWEIKILHRHENEHNGLKNVSFEIIGKNVYGTLKHESGVHRLVRVSPFSSKKLRHTSFSLVEVIPRFVEAKELEIPEKDIRIEFSRSSGPGGQNVNKRETAVRLVHIPTNIAVHVETERSQAQNRDRALEVLKAKLYNLRQHQQRKEQEALGSADVEIEWGHQIRSYVLHPYKMVKDHRTEMETANVENILDGNLEKFIEAEKGL